MREVPLFDFVVPKREGAAAMMVLGTMGFGTITPEDEAIRIMDMAIKRGVNWFDTSSSYAGGEAERIIGRYLKQKKVDMVLATQAGGTSARKTDLSRAAIHAEIEGSLQRLEREFVDLYYLHAPDPQSPLTETIQALEEARTAGKISAWALANFPTARIAEVRRLCIEMNAPPPHISQILYNLLIRDAETDYFAYAKSEKLHTTVYSPLGGGLLAGAEPHSQVAADSPEAGLYLTPAARELAALYAALAKESGLDPTVMALAWLSRRPGVDSMILGPDTAAELEDAVDDWGVELDPAVLAKIDQLQTQAGSAPGSYAL